MPNLHNRTRVVYVRVSEDEFRQIRDLCQQRGARNLSDLVRSAMEMMIRERGTDFESNVQQRLENLEESLNQLNRSMAQIASERS